VSVINIGSWRKDELIHNTFLKVNKNDVGLYRFRTEKIEPLNRVKKEDL
jgi:hypothetical protein